MFHVLLLGTHVGLRTETVSYYSIGKSCNKYFDKPAQISPHCVSQNSLCQFFRLTHSRSVILVPQQYFRSRVGQRTTRGVQFFPGLKPVAEAEVSELDDSLLLKEDHVFWLQVPVHYVQPVTVGDGMDNLGKVTLGHLEKERQRGQQALVISNSTIIISVSIYCFGSL